MTAASKDLDKANNSLSNTIAPLEISVTSNVDWSFTNGSNLVATKQCIIFINLIYFYLHFFSLTIYVWI